MGRPEDAGGNQKKKYLEQKADVGDETATITTGPA